MRLAGFFLCLGARLSAQSPDAAEIMRRVSANLDRSEAARAHYVYDQDVFVRLQRANGKLAREESRQYTATCETAISPAALASFAKLKSQWPNCRLKISI